MMIKEKKNSEEKNHFIKKKLYNTTS